MPTDERIHGEAVDAASKGTSPAGGRDAIGERLVLAEDLQARVADLAAAISADYAGKRLLLVCVLKGAVFFLSDLMRHIDIPVEVDFMAVASYGSATDSSGVVRAALELIARRRARTMETAAGGRVAFRRIAEEEHVGVAEISERSATMRV